MFFDTKCPLSPKHFVILYCVQCHWFLKGVCHEIFDLHFFHAWNQSRPLMNRIKYFRIRFQFHQDVPIFKKLCSVHHTAESSSEVCTMSRSQALWRKSHRRVKLHGVHLTAGQTLQCASLLGVELCGVHHTAESDSAVSITPQCTSHRGVNNLPVSVLIWSFTNPISLWYLKILLWK